MGHPPKDQMSMTCRRLLMASLLILCHAFLIPGKNVSVSQELSEGDYQRTLDQLFPPFDPDSLGRNTRWVLGLRILPPWDPEFAATLQKDYNGKVTVNARRVKSSIQRHLEAMDENQSLDAKLKAIKVEAATLDAGNCPRIQRWASDFERMKLNVVPEDEIYADATTYELSVYATYGNSAVFKIRGPLGVKRLRNQPLVAWANGFQDDAKACMSKLNR